MPLSLTPTVTKSLSPTLEARPKHDPHPRSLGAGEPAKGAVWREYRMGWATSARSDIRQERLVCAWTTVVLRPERYSLLAITRSPNRRQVPFRATDHKLTPKPHSGGPPERFWDRRKVLLVPRSCRSLLRNSGEDSLDVEVAFGYIC